MNIERIAAALLLGLSLPTPSRAQDADIITWTDVDGVPLKLINGIPEGWVRIDGDILVPADHPATESGCGCPGNTPCTWGPINPWTNGIVYYDFDANVSGQNRERAREAMDEWIETESDVVFLPRTNETFWIRFVDANENSSAVGMVGSPQIVNMVSWGEKFIIAHELGHALGFLHEQSRSNRDTYVEINCDNIESGSEHNFTHYSDYNDSTTYDFDSVMHYGQCEFSSCSLCPLPWPACIGDADNGRTIVMQPGYEMYQDMIGQRDHLSAGDQLDMALLYGYGPGVVYIDHTQGGGGDGSLADPYNTFSAGYQNAGDGDDIWIRSGTYSAVGTYDKPLRVQPYLGGAVTLQ